MRNPHSLSLIACALALALACLPALAADKVAPDKRVIDALESEADSLMRAGISKLFREEQDVRQLIKHKNVYEYLENAIDKCQDVANIIEAVVVDNV